MFFLNKKHQKVFVALSGGVDSSVAALLLKRAGYQVFGGFIRGYNLDGCQDKEAYDARLVAEKLGIPFYVFDFEKEYKERVVNYILEGYRKGITPNPDVVCNSQIKFGLFYNQAKAMGADFVASGHYAILKRNFFTRKVSLFQAKDKNKDQTYFLWQVPYERFKQLIFPIGSFKKEEVRRLAKKFDLPTAEKKDSQGICFLGKFKFSDFLKQHLGEKEGEIIDVYGKKVGVHRGVWFYTLGQKHGFINTAGREFYVIDKDLQNNVLIVAYKENKEVYCQSFKVTDLNFLDDEISKAFKNKKEIKVLVRVRYRQPLLEAKISPLDFSLALITTKEPQMLFPASGQSAVFYSKKGQVLGGGVIV